jgi:lipopolysaccharide export system permease protein
MANNAELKDGGREGLSLELENAFVQSSKEIVREDYDYAHSSYLQYWVSNEDIIQAVVSISPREMSSRDVHAAIKNKNSDLTFRINERKGRVMTQALALENTLRAGPSGDGWNRRINTNAGFLREVQTLDGVKNDRSLLIHLIEFHKKFSVPFGAFFFVFLAVSLGLMAKKSGQTVGFIFGNIIAALYWVFLFYGQTMGLRFGTPPFWSMWFPNILSLAAGIVLAIIRIRK